MSELGKQIRAYLLADSNLTDIVGQVIVEDSIPATDQTPYIWFQQAGEEQTDALNCSDTETTDYNFEAYSEDIDEARDLTSKLKARLRAASQADTELAGNVHSIDVQNHDDSYLPKSIAVDDGTHAGSLLALINHTAGFAG